ncbi:MAG: glycosyltransferase family 4 protein [Patescibacteria group bacterium]
MEQHTLDLAKGMIDRGHELFVWCADGKLAQLFSDLGADVTRKTPSLDIDPVYIFALSRFLKSKKIEIMHSHELKASVNALIAGALSGTPARITHTHTPISEWQIEGLKKKVDTAVYRFLVNKFSSREIALTDSRKYIKQLEGIKEEKLEVIPNGLDTARFSVGELQRRDYRHEILERLDLPSNAFIFGNISRLTKEKGHDVLLDAFAQFLKSSEDRKLDISNVFLVIAGGGELEGSLKAKVSELGITERVFFTGRFEDADLIKLYSTFDAFLFPSLAEGFGLVLVEAMASGISVICSDLDVLKEVGGPTVMYFETGNALALSEKMYDLYMRFDRFAELRESAVQRVAELFTMERFLDGYENLYKELLNI